MKRATIQVRRNQIEHDHQVSFFQWLRLNEKKHPALKRFFAIPNGGHRERGVAIKMYLEGTRRGVPDTHLPLARQGHAGLWIEFKAGDNQLTPEQVEWKALLELEGHVVYVCREWTEAAQLTVAYLGLQGIPIPNAPGVGHVQHPRAQWRMGT